MANIGVNLSLELFLTPSEKDAFGLWQEEQLDRSIAHKVVNPVFKWIADQVPDQVAPNTISFAGSLLVIQAWYFSELYSRDFPRLVTFIACVSILSSYVFGRIDGVHAKRTLQDTTLGELFKYMCDNVSAVFLVVVLCRLTGAEDAETHWYCVQLGQLLLLIKHHSAFVREAGLRFWLFGPGELLLVIIAVLIGKQLVGWAWAVWLYDYSAGLIAQALLKVGIVKSCTPVRMWYFLGVAFTTVRIAVLGDMTKDTQRYTRKALLLVMVLRAIPAAFLIMYGASADWGINMQDVLCDGLFMGVVTSDLIVAKMAGRELHVWIVVMAAAVIVPHLQFVTFSFFGFYYLSILTDLMVYFNLPFLTTAKNVYCDGVYDLCHIGHKNLFKAALKFGNRLFVGVCNDEECAKYKRPPIMSAAERESEVFNCKGVTKVIPNAPTFGLTEAFIKKHRIHVVAMGQEYIDRYPDPKDDPYYRYPREIGIARPLPRTLSLSTTELIKRIQAGVQLEKNSPT